MKLSASLEDYDCQLSYNSTYAFLQFKCYRLSFADMSKIIHDIKVDFTLPLPFGDIDENKCEFTTNQYDT